MIAIMPLIAVFIVLALLTFIIGNSVIYLRRNPIRTRLMGSHGTLLGESGNSKEGLMAGFADQLPVSSIDNGKLDRDLRRAGYYQRNARQNYLAIRNALVWGIVVLTGLLCVIIGPTNQDFVLKALLVGLVLAAMCWSIPRVALHFIGEKRCERINRGLPDALDMITMCLNGGLSIQYALDHVSRELRTSHAELAVELYVLRRQAEMSSIYEALDQLNKRIDTNEIFGFSALIDHTCRLGTNASTAMNRFADDLRVNRNELADERANKASVQLLLPIVFCLLPAVFIILWGPAILDLSEFLASFEGASGS